MTSCSKSPPATSNSFARPKSLAIAREARQYAQQLADLTGAYAETGEGLQSDANARWPSWPCARMIICGPKRDCGSSLPDCAQLLRLDPALRLSPLDPAIVPLDLVCPTTTVGELVVQGLTARPELAEQRHLVSFAVQRIRREQYAALMPSVVLGVSYGGFGGGIGGTMAQFNNRIGCRCDRFLANAQPRFRRSCGPRRGAIAGSPGRSQSPVDARSGRHREIVEAHAQVTLRKKEIAIAHEGLTAASASYRHNIERIEQAKGLPIEAMQALQAIIQARRELLRALIDYNVAQFTLYRAIGWPTRFPETAPKASA